MRVLVTGGCGFIGSNLAEELCKEYEVTVVDNLSTGNEVNLRGLDVDFVEGDVRDLGLLEELFRDVDFVLHQAAVVSVPESIEDTVRANEVNVGGTLNVLVAARDCGVRKVVSASSCAVYGDASALPISEDTLPHPGSPYAASKLAAEYYCNVFKEIYGLDTVSLRYFNIYGPKQNPNSDYAAVIPQFITRALNGSELVIHGDGKQTRDFVFVKDVVKANKLAMESQESGVFNVATGREVSIQELAHRIRGLTNNVDVRYEGARKGDIRNSVGDSRRLSRIYEPIYGIEDGLRETVEWFRSL